jgi:hypothetical protein
MFECPCSIHETILEINIPGLVRHSSCLNFQIPVKVPLQKSSFAGSIISLTPPSDAPHQSFVVTSSIKSGVWNIQESHHFAGVPQLSARIMDIIRDDQVIHHGVRSSPYQPQLCCYRIDLTSPPPICLWMIGEFSGLAKKKSQSSNELY